MNGVEELATRVAPPLLESGSMLNDPEAQGLLDQQKPYLQKLFVEYCSAGRSTDTSTAGRGRMPIRCLQSLANDAGLVPNTISKQGAYHV